MDITPEEWRPVVGYEGFYEVSDHGRVRSLDRVLTSHRGRILKPAGRWGGHGYHVVRLSVDGVVNERKIHHLVAEAFIGCRPAGLMVLHYNDIKTDNRLLNLRYGTQRENILDKVRNGLNPNANKTHCPQGHEYTPENTLPRHRPGGGRDCHACRKRRDRDRKRFLAAQAKAANAVK